MDAALRAFLVIVVHSYHVMIPIVSRNLGIKKHPSTMRCKYNTSRV